MTRNEWEFESASMRAIVLLVRLHAVRLRQLGLTQGATDRTEVVEKWERALNDLEVAEGLFGGLEP